jgi:hypothetical protein
MTFARRITEKKEREERFAERCVPSRALVKGSYTGSTSGETVDKERASQHSGYMAAVRGLGYCMRCGLSCRPQFCHRDEGKGMGIKTDVRDGWPGCAECHWLIGTSGTYPKEERRAIEEELGRKTRQAVKADGTWPKSLPIPEETTCR